ncbi:hypothetical protein K438DRAFT_1975825 [Mycena galopus ATCC 62051]|nr:hypothetical protein K438DRAFT_1975825 [Mycena galopus ATCC 62051]
MLQIPSMVTSPNPKVARYSSRQVLCVACGRLMSVLQWIFPGGFEFGASSRSDDTTIVERSITMVIYVTMDPSVSAFGYLASKEVRAVGVGNLGLQDRTPVVCSALFIL